MIFRPRFSRFSADTNPKNRPFFRLTVEVLDRYGRDKIGMPKAQMDDLGPVADPGASPTVKRAINALQEASPTAHGHMQ